MAGYVLARMVEEEDARSVEFLCDEDGDPLYFDAPEDVREFGIENGMLEEDWTGEWFAAELFMLSGEERDAEQT